MTQGPTPGRPLRRVVILGGGVAGWVTAAALSRALPAGRYEIALVESGGEDRSLSPFGPAEASLPSLGALHRELGIDEDEALRRARGCFSLGIACTGWARPGVSYFLPFGDTGAALGSVAFHQLAGRVRAEGRAVRLADYSLAALAAQAGRFTRPVEDLRSVLSSFSYGLHLLGEGYARFLEEHAPGVARHAGLFSRAELGEDGAIAALLLEGGGRVAADLFIDCSGPVGLLIDGALGTGFESWKQWLPCNRAASFLREDPGAQEPYSHAAADGAGWRRHIPLQGLRAETRFWSSAFLRDDQAPTIAFEQGRRALFWNRNCIAIGASAATLEPLQPSALHLVRTAIARLVSLFPEQADAPVEAAEYNRLAIGEAERIRDYLIARYKTNGRVGEPFWDACRAMDVPEPLAYRLDLYRSRGSVVLYDEETFEAGDWIMMLDEQGVRPRRYDPLADAIPAQQIDRHFARIREVLIDAVRPMPTHSAYLARHCAAREEAPA